MDVALESLGKSRDPAREPAHGQGGAAAFLTASFSVGQMLGPVVAGMLADRQDGFALPLLLAAASVTLGGLFVAVDRRYQSLKPEEGVASCRT